MHIQARTRICAKYLLFAAETTNCKHRISNNFICGGKYQDQSAYHQKCSFWARCIKMWKIHLLTTKALALTPEWALTWTVASVTWMRKLVYTYRALTCLKKQAWKGHLQFVL
jgi:hypothetical protein